MPSSRYQHMDPAILRKMVLSNAVSAINDYLFHRWTREDGSKIKIEMEINEDIVEYAFSKEELLRCQEG